jgi:hypothetical protein
MPYKQTPKKGKPAKRGGWHNWSDRNNYKFGSGFSFAGGNSNNNTGIDKDELYRLVKNYTEAGTSGSRYDESPNNYDRFQSYDSYEGRGFQM